MSLQGKSDERNHTIDSLKKRTSIKARITRIQTFVKDFKQTDIIQLLKARKLWLNQAYKEYNDIQSKTEEIDTTYQAVEMQERDRGDRNKILRNLS